MSDARRYYDALKRVSKGYQTPEELRRNAEHEYGLDYEEVLEMAYENIQEVARRAIYRKRRPKE